MDRPYQSPDGQTYIVPWLTEIPGFSFAKGETGTLDKEGNIQVELIIGEAFQGDQRIERGSLLQFDKDKKLQKITGVHKKRGG